MAQNNEEHSLYLDHFVKDVEEEETYVCKSCGKKYGVTLLGNHLTNCVVLSPCDSFFQKLKTMIWSIQVHYKKGIAVGTGFSVSNDGLIMTAAHIFGKVEKAKRISVHRMDKKIREKVDIVYYRPKSDLALLKVPKIDSCESVEFLSNVWLSAGEELITVGVSTCLLGHAFFGCTEIKGITRDEKCITKTYKPEPSVKKYRVLGDVYNAENFKKDRCSHFLRNLNPFVPIIESQLNTVPGNSGSPVFNGKGEVVGMVHGHSGPDSISIHVSELVDFLDDYIKRMVDRPSRYATKDIQEK